MTTAQLSKPALDYNRPPPDGIAGLQRLAAPLMGQIRNALPRVMAGSAERMVRCLLTCCQATPALLDCTPKSLLGGCIQVASLGLELGGPAGQAYLIPFKKQAQLVVGYKGFITLGHRAGTRRFTPRVVREGDTFEVVYGTSQYLTHVPKFTPGAPATHYYTVIETRTGGIDFEVMTHAEAVSHKDRYALAKNGPWATNFDEMAMKTTIRRIAKRCPLSVEWTRAAVLDEQAEQDVPQQLSAAVVLEGETAEDDAVARLRARADAAAGDADPDDAEAQLRERAEAGGG
jgi:recombination protein RecT